MPKLWTDTIDAHRRMVRDAALDATAALVAAHGLASVTMSRIAEEAGIARATLYKHFRDIEAILVAWHERHVHRHLADLVAVVAGAADAGEQLERALTAYALILHEQPATELAAALHSTDHAKRAEDELEAFLGELVAAGVRARELRDDVPPAELTGFVLHALAAAGTAPSTAAVHRLVTVVLDGLRRAPS